MSDLKTDYTPEALERLLTTLKGDAKTDGLIASYLDRCQELEAAAHPMLVQRDIDSAEGVQLTGIGEIVGEPRGGRDDELYRVFLRVRILVNRSRATASDLIEIVGTRAEQDPLSWNVELDEYFPRTIFIRARDFAEAFPQTVAALLRQARGAGFRLHYIYTEQKSDANVFRFATGATSDLGATYGLSAGHFAGAA